MLCLGVLRPSGLLRKDLICVVALNRLAPTYWLSIASVSTSIFARLASEIFLSSPQTEIFSNLLVL